MIVQKEAVPLHKERTELLIKLDKTDNYKTDEERQKDALRVGELEKELKDMAYNAIKNSKPVLAKKVQKEYSFKEIAKIAIDKYDHYKGIGEGCRELYDSTLIKKKNGRDMKSFLRIMNKKYISLNIKPDYLKISMEVVENLKGTPNSEFLDKTIEKLKSKKDFNIYDEVLKY